MTALRQVLAQILQFYTDGVSNIHALITSTLRHEPSVNILFKFGITCL